MILTKTLAQLGLAQLCQLPSLRYEVLHAWWALYNTNLALLDTFGVILAYCVGPQNTTKLAEIDPKPVKNNQNRLVKWPPGVV